MISIFVDLDGILRDLEASVFGYRVEDWNTPVQGEEFFTFMDKNLHLLEEASTAKYYVVVRNFYRDNGFTLQILTHQNPHWRERTERWIEKYFDDVQYEITYVNSGRDKTAYLEDAILIDDHPHLVGHPNVVVIDKLYNKECPAGFEDSYLRINTPQQLTRILEYCYNQGSKIENFYDDLSEMRA